jgi:imidazoleglycerol-phosphate dehydratase
MALPTNPTSPRKAAVKRTTKETDISVEVNLDGEGRSDISTGIGFFDHMLTSLSKHSRIDMAITCKGDLPIDDHHSVEDVAITLGQAIVKALGQKQGIERYGWALIPMDETLARSAIDLSGRSVLVFKAAFSRPEINGFSTEMVEHFFFSLAEHLKANIHLEICYGRNTHHKVEGLFKALAVAMRQAVKITSDDMPSTKGVI